MQQNMSDKTKSMVEASLIGVIIFIIMLMTIYIPVFNIVGVFILPIPVTVLYIRHNFKTALAAVLISGILNALITNPINTATTIFMYSIIGILMGYCIKNKCNFKKTIIILTIASLISIILSISVDAIFIEKNGITGIINDQISMMKNVTKEMEASYKKQGVNTTSIKQFKDFIMSMTVQKAMPIISGTLLIISLMSAYINLFITQIILNKIGYKVYIRRQFSKLYIPNLFAAVIIGITCIGIILKSRSIAAGEYIYTTGFMFIEFLLVADAVSLLYYYAITRFRMSRVGTIVIILILSLIMSNALVIIGIIDFVLNLRKLDPARKHKIFKWGPPDEK